MSILTELQHLNVKKLRGNFEKRALIRRAPHIGLHQYQKLEKLYYNMDSAQYMNLLAILLHILHCGGGHVTRAY
ncbi:MAG: hypothetical protein CFE33_04710 [Pseudorhodobacter sp. PARRP1]|nr:MAG: hypothetical protein CFE33_04710 [Pseudorhodobacter sp. PARRP1]